VKRPTGAALLQALGPVAAVALALIVGAGFIAAVGTLPVLNAGSER